MRFVEVSFKPKNGSDVFSVYYVQWIIRYGCQVTVVDVTARGGVGVRIVRIVRIVT